MIKKRLAPIFEGITQCDNPQEENYLNKISPFDKIK
jgi:hypothetical protein